MALYLLDTNILIGLTDADAASRPAARHAVRTLLKQGHICVLVAQVLIEFWSVSSRPVNKNGLGLSTKDCRAEIDQLRSQFPILDDTASVLDRWLTLVTQLQISGNRAHDIRLLGIMLEHSVSYILTFNTKDFPAVEGITVVHPKEISEYQ